MSNQVLHDGYVCTRRKLPNIDETTSDYRELEWCVPCGAYHKTEIYFYPSTLNSCTGS